MTACIEKYLGAVGKCYGVALARGNADGVALGGNIVGLIAQRLHHLAPLRPWHGGYGNVLRVAFYDNLFIASLHYHGLGCVGNAGICKPC